MATPTKRRSENVPGEIYVDSTCIDCDTCRWMAPEVFKEQGGQSAVHHQPATPELKLKALQALVACPTASIGAAPGEPLLKDAVASFPIPIDGPVCHAGYHSENSYGAASYFIKRAAGNVLIDSPRFAAPLVKRLEAEGGVKYLYLTHRDDVADHADLRKHFGCERILHADDIDAGTRSVEIVVKGEGELRLADDIVIIPVPGHTKGHTVLNFQNKYLFTGDHLAYSERRGRLVAFHDACWYSWGEQTRSMEKLLNYRFEWVLPGHGRRWHADAGAMHEALAACVKWMKEFK